MDPVAIITGASQGLGLALARALAERRMGARHRRPPARPPRRRGRRVARQRHPRRRRRRRHHRPRSSPAARRRRRLPRAGPARRQQRQHARREPAAAARRSSTPTCCARRSTTTSSLRSRSSQLLAPHLHRRRDDRQHHVATRRSRRYPTWGGYGASKAALEHAGRVLAAEHPSGLRVLTVDPGDMRTEMHQDAFPDEDIGDRPLPEASVPGSARPHRRRATERPLRSHARSRRDASASSTPPPSGARSQPPISRRPSRGRLVAPLPLVFDARRRPRGARTAPRRVAVARDDVRLMVSPGDRRAGRTHASASSPITCSPAISSSSTPRPPSPPPSTPSLARRRRGRRPRLDRAPRRSLDGRAAAPASPTARREPLDAGPIVRPSARLDRRQPLVRSRSARHPARSASGWPRSAADADLARRAHRSGRPIRYRYVPRDWPIEATRPCSPTEPGSAEMPSAARPFTEAIVDAARPRRHRHRPDHAAHRRLVTRGLTSCRTPSATGSRRRPRPRQRGPRDRRPRHRRRHHGGAGARDGHRRDRHRAPAAAGGPTP